MGNMENKSERVKLILASSQKFYMVTKFNKMKSTTCEEGGLQNLWSNLFVPMTLHVKIKIQNFPKIWTYPLENPDLGKFGLFLDPFRPKTGGKIMTFKYI